MKLGYVLLYVEDVEQSMAFYAKAFGLEKGFVSEGKEYGEMVTGETKLGFVSHALVSSHGFEYEKMTRAKKPGSNEIALTTPKVDAAFKKAVDAGATPLCKPEKKPWGQITSLVRDSNGFLVEISSPMGEGA